MILTYFITLASLALYHRHQLHFIVGSKAKKGRETDEAYGKESGSHNTKYCVI
jgi:hypothetical protein